MKAKLLLLGFSLLSTALTIAQTKQSSAEPPSLYKQLYSVKYTFLGIAASAEFRLQKRAALNIESSMSIVPILSAAAGKTFNGLDMLSSTSPNQKLTLEPKYFLNKKSATDNNSYNSVSVAFTRHFPETSLRDTACHGYSIIPRFTLNSNISKRFFFQTGFGYGMAFISSNHNDHLIKGISSLVLKLGFAVAKAP